MDGRMIDDQERMDAMQFIRLRSALYNWPAKIEHWPADSNGFLLVKRGIVQNTAVFSDIYLSALECSSSDSPATTWY